MGHCLTHEGNQRHIRKAGGLTYPVAMGSQADLFWARVKNFHLLSHAPLLILFLLFWSWQLNTTPFYLLPKESLAFPLFMTWVLRVKFRS